MKKFTSIVLLALSATAIRADAPKVVTSIVPIQGLVADIMAGVGAPEVLLGEPISPHDFALRPSQARAIASADVLFYVGQHLEPWLEKALQSRAQSDLVVALGDMPNLIHLEPRELQDFGEMHEDHDHEHGEVIDPHLWLEPENALLWLDVIAGILEVADPVNKDAYRENLERARSEISVTAGTISAELATLVDIEMIVTHDSTQYFEAAYGLNVIGAFTASDGQTTGARNLNALLGQLGPDTCVVEDFTHPSKITASLPDDVNHVVIDPMGYDSLGETGSYSRLLSDIADSLMGCRD